MFALRICTTLGVLSREAVVIAAGTGNMETIIHQSLLSKSLCVSSVKADKVDISPVLVEDSHSSTVPRDCLKSSLPTVLHDLFVWWVCEGQRAT